MRILVCPLYDNTFSSRFRIYRYLPYWEQAGIECDVVPAVRPALHKACEQFPRIYHRWRMHLSEISIRRKSIRESSNYDLVLIQKGFTTIDWRWWPGMQQRQKVPFLFDVDDAVHLEPGLVPPRVLRFLWDSKQIEKIGRAAEAVVVGNPYLAEDFRKFSRRVEEIPTSLDLRHYTYTPDDRKRQVERLRDGEFYIGWSGSSSSHPLLNSVLPIVRQIHEKYPHVKMQIISNTASGIEFELLGNTPCQMTLWSPQQEIPAIKAMDVGLMPLSDSPWMKYKCALKAIQYMALGAVAVCSPVGVNADIIRHGVNGYLAKGDGEWFEILEYLVTNRESLEAVRETARKTVEEGFSIEKNSQHWIQLFQEVGLKK